MMFSYEQGASRDQAEHELHFVEGEVAALGDDIIQRIVRIAPSIGTKEDQVAIKFLAIAELTRRKLLKLQHELEMKQTAPCSTCTTVTSDGRTSP